MFFKLLRNLVSAHVKLAFAWVRLNAHCALSGCGRRSR